MSLFHNPMAAPAALAAALLAAGAAQAQDLPSAHRFVAAIYGHYPTSDKRPSFEPTGSLAPALFDAALVRLIREDQRLAKGEVGALDGDPFCDCQDDGGTSYTVGPGQAGAAGAAIVKVERRGPGAEKPETITLDLVHTPVGWRVHDIHTVNSPSLRRLLEDGVKEERKAG
jgi:hypothetical protein